MGWGILCVCVCVCLSAYLLFIPGASACCRVSLDAVGVIPLSLWGIGVFSFLASSPCRVFNKQPLSVIRP